MVWVLYWPSLHADSSLLSCCGIVANPSLSVYFYKLETVSQPADTPFPTKPYQTNSVPPLLPLAVQHRKAVLMKAPSDISWGNIYQELFCRYKIQAFFLEKRLDLAWNCLIQSLHWWRMKDGTFSLRLLACLIDW